MQLRRLSLLLAFVLALACAASVGASEPTAPAPGIELYSRYCADCHRPLASTNVPDRSAKRIRSAINVFPSMSALRPLSDSDLAAIAAVLATGAYPLAQR